MKLLRTLLQYFLNGTPQAGWLFPDKLPDDPEARRIVAGTMFWAYLIPTIVLTLVGIFSVIFLVAFFYKAATMHTDEVPKSDDIAEVARVERINYEYHRTHMTDYTNYPGMTEDGKKVSAEAQQFRLAKELEEVKKDEAAAAAEKARKH